MRTVDRGPFQRIGRFGERPAGPKSKQDGVDPLSARPIYPGSAQSLFKMAPDAPPTLLQTGRTSRQTEHRAIPPLPLGGI